MRLYLSNGFPLKIAISTLVRQAVRKGALLKLPCWTCDNPKTEAHHADYSMPLDVVWLCHRCHMQLHGNVKTWLRERRSRDGVLRGAA